MLSVSYWTQTMRIRAFFTTTGLVEALTGLGLLVAPSLVAKLLLGDPLETNSSLILGRVLGTALVSIGISCFIARKDGQSKTALGLIAAMLLYNLTVVVLFAYARVGLGMTGLGLWPGIVLHLVMSVWCVACLRRTS